MALRTHQILSKLQKSNRSNIWGNLALRPNFGQILIGWPNLRKSEISSKFQMLISFTVLSIKTLFESVSWSPAHAWDSRMISKYFAITDGNRLFIAQFWRPLLQPNFHVASQAQSATPLWAIHQILSNFSKFEQCLSNLGSLTQSQILTKFVF